MVDLPESAPVLFGDYRQFGGYLLIGLCIVVSVSLIYPSINDLFNIVPESSPDWGLIVVFVGAPAAIAARNGGSVSCWAVGFPSLFVIYTWAFTKVVAHGPRVYTPETVGPAVLLGIVVALLYGTLGYIVGRIFRAVGSRVSSHDRDATH